MQRCIAHAGATDPQAAREVEKANNRAAVAAHRSKKATYVSRVPDDQRPPKRKGQKVEFNGRPINDYRAAFIMRATAACDLATWNEKAGPVTAEEIAFAERAAKAWTDLAAYMRGASALI